MNTAEKIKKIFEDSKLSYIELEHLTGVSRSSLQRYANGITEKIPLEVIEVISERFNVSPAYLMGWTDERDKVYTDDYMVYVGDYEEDDVRVTSERLIEEPLLKSAIGDVVFSKEIQKLVNTVTDLTDDEISKVTEFAEFVKNK